MSACPFIALSLDRKTIKRTNKGMKKNTIIAAFLALAAFAVKAQTELSTPHWENPLFFEQNKLAAHATFMPYSTTAAMTSDGRYEKPWLEPTGADFLSLNGTWKFFFVSNTDERPGKSAFFGDDADVSTWDNYRSTVVLGDEGL